jgi:uncharacterized protein (TIGR02145 family)
MKIMKNRFRITGIILLILIVHSCKKDKTTSPVLTTTSISGITATTAISGGNITSDGGASVSERGVCWNTLNSPTTANNKTSDGSGTGDFSSILTGLTGNTKYYVRAYAANSVSTAYGNEIDFTTSSAGTSDIDGNSYTSLIIGTQVWMKENLKTTKFNDGTSIPIITDKTVWANLSTPGYCWYNNDATTYKPLYGALYNWYTVNTGKLCPTGWHVPTQGEWSILAIYLGGESVAGGKLKETGTSHWLSPNTGANNTSGFTAIPGGYRYTAGEFDFVGMNGFWWSTNESITGWSYDRELDFDSEYFFEFNDPKKAGFSIRCVKN